MKELLKSKMMIAFALFVIGIALFSSINEKNAQKNDLRENQASQAQIICTK